MTRDDGAGTPLGIVKGLSSPRLSARRQTPVDLQPTLTTNVQPKSRGATRCLVRLTNTRLTTSEVRPGDSQCKYFDLFR